MPTVEKAASDYTEYVKKRASVVGRREFSDSLFNSLILQSSVGRGLGNTPEGPPPTPSGEYGVLTGFDYPDKVLYYPNFGDPGDFTVELFFKCWDVNYFQRVWGFHSNSGDENVILTIDSRIISYQYDDANGGYTRTITTLTPNTWYHIGLTRSESSWYASINGSTFEIDLGSPDLTGAELCVGDESPNDTPFLTGSISNFRISGPLYTPGTYTIPSLPLSASGAKLLLLANPGAEFADSTGRYVSEYSCGWEAGPIPSIPQPRTDYGVLTGFSGDSTLWYPNFGMTGDFTMEFFFKSSDPQNAYYDALCFFQTGESSPYIGIRLSNGSILFSDSEEEESELGSIEANTWYHVALSRSGTEIYISINGHTQQRTDYLNLNISEVGLNIGGFGGVDGQAYSCSISNVRISSVAKYTESSYTVPTIPMEPSETDLLLLLAKPDAPFADTVLLPRTPKVSETNCGWAPGPIDLPTTDYGVLTGFDDSVMWYPDFGSLPANFTVEFFFKCQDTESNQCVFYFDNVTNTHIGLYINEEFLAVESNDLEDNISILSRDTYYHVALSRNSSNWYASINGTTVEMAGASLDLTNASLCIGNRRPNSTFDTFDPFISGSISNFRVSSVAKYTNPTLGYTVPSVPLQSESTDLLLLLAKPDAPFADTIFPESGRTPKEPENTCKWGPGPIVAPITDYGVLTGFDSSSLYYDSFSLPQSFTVELFFNASDFSFGNYLFTFADTSYFLTGYCNQSGMFFESDELELNDTSIGNINTGTWYHTALTRDGSNWYASINGNTVSCGVGSQTFDNMSLIIGGFQIEVSSSNLRGSISNFRISNYARYTTNYYQVPSVPMTPASTDLLLLLAQPNAKFVDSSTFNRTPETTCEWGPGEPIVV
jgi:hypothetical protein